MAPRGEARAFYSSTLEGILKRRIIMTVQQILEKVNALSQGKDIVEVYIWDKASFAVTMVGSNELQDRLSFQKRK